MRLSKNFTLKELIKSETATRKGINNNPNEDHIENLQKLCDNLNQRSVSYVIYVLKFLN